jgi:hypothetical protein
MLVRSIHPEHADPRDAGRGIRLFPPGGEVRARAARPLNALRAGRAALGVRERVDPEDELAGGPADHDDPFAPAPAFVPAFVPAFTPVLAPAPALAPALAVMTPRGRAIR